MLVFKLMEIQNVLIPASKKTQCVDVLKGGVLGFFGAKEEQCFEVEIPEVNIDSVLIGGGKITTYILESELQEGKVIINIDSLPFPSSMEQLQYNYELFNNLEAFLTFT